MEYVFIQQYIYLLIDFLETISRRMEINCDIGIIPRYRITIAIKYSDKQMPVETIILINMFNS